MSTDDERIPREQQHDKSQPLGPEDTLTLSDNQLTFLRHAIRDIHADPVIDAKIAQRVKGVQERAIEAFPYSCIRYFRYVTLGMAENDVFAHVVEAGQSSDPPVLLDIGCCMGTDLRYLVHLGYRPTSLIGCDVEQAFIDLGHDLYADRETCLISFIAGDIFGLPIHSSNHSALANGVPRKLTANVNLTDVKELADLRGRVQYIYAGALFHLFDEAAQEGLARRLVVLLDPSRPALVFGRHVACAVEGVVESNGRRPVGGSSNYAHSPASWERLWRRVLGDARPVRVDASLDPIPTLDWASNAHLMAWSVWIG